MTDALVAANVRQLMVHLQEHNDTSWIYAEMVRWARERWGWE